MPRSSVTADDREYRDDTIVAYERAVERAIDVMHTCLSEPLSIDDLADVAFMSRFHFTRVFSKVTGISPARFLAAVRIQEAKQLLLNTDRSITEVSLDVGYNSLGTFTRIFSDFVAFPPVRFRQLSRPLLQLTLDDVASLLPLKSAARDEVSVCGEIKCASPLALVIVAMFPTSIPRSHPAECVCLTDSAHFSFNRRVSSDVRIFAAGLISTATIKDALLMSQDRVQVGVRQLTNYVPTSRLCLELRQRRETEPPIVIAYPLLIAESLVAARVSNLREEVQLPQ